MEFQKRLHDLRKQSGLSQEGLADLLGVTRQAVQKWEAGTSRPDMDNLVALARYFDVSLDYLATGQEPTASNQPAPILIRHCPWYYEYKSSRTLFGLPLVHIRLGDRGFGVARGIFAVGNIAVGVFTLGGISLGIFGLGGISLCLLLSLGGLAIGSVAIGGCAVGLLALGGCAIGLLAGGGGAFGVYAVGGGAAGTQIAIGGTAHGPLAIGRESAIGALTFSIDTDPAILWAAVEQATVHLPGPIAGLVRSFLQVSLSF